MHKRQHDVMRQPDSHHCCRHPLAVQVVLERRQSPAPLPVLWHQATAAAREALDLPFRAFPSWFLRIECERCGKIIMHNEVHMPDRQPGMVLRVLLSRMRHEGCGGRAATAELMTGIEGVSSLPVRRIVLLGG
jgi:hypothetical protein